MMDWVLEWLPWVPPLFISGIFNLLVAYQKLYRDCRSPLFNPWSSFGVWWWVVVQLALPSLIFFFYAKISTKPTVDFLLYWTAVLVGSFFTLFVNANADFGFISFSIDKVYAFLNELAYKSIASGQTARLASFKQDLKQELMQNPSTLDDGLNWIQDYFSEDIALKSNLIEQNELLEEVKQALAENKPDEKVAEVIALVMKIRRKDCKQLLSRFGSEETLKKYFSGFFQILLSRFFKK
jgi:hypothetical protein